ncbi:hypothetical protein E7T09_08270 [Deinococcus sp. KSM4-11]|uniref:hypothetical protein n=1 Tax=Deinococcus sp. KSM4-11 TaxID=2568654 RepID=UPI0010A526D7|nr:hypothetical protein [Deinococcus sp. KSM4-11]THF87147.1 hypothetical protein E7T09_08270 [Deinococcus sp. KSM4-11]
MFVRAVAGGALARSPALEAVSNSTTAAISVDSLAALRARVNTGAPVRTRGYYAPRDGGGAIYDPIPGDTTSTDDGLGLIVAADGTRYQLRDAVTARRAGAKGDLLTDDTAAFLRLSRYRQVTIEAGRYRITQPIPVGYYGGVTLAGCVWMGESRASTTIIGDFGAGQAGRAVLEVGDGASIHNFGHRLLDFLIRHGANTPSNCWGVRIYNAYGGSIARVDIRARNCLNLARPGGQGFTFLNYLVDDCLLYAKYTTNLTTGDEISLGPSDNGVSVANTPYLAGIPGHRWDDVTFRYTRHNALVDLAGSMVTFESPQFYNEKKTTWTFAQAGYTLSDPSTISVYFRDGSLVMRSPNFEVYQTGLAIGTYNRKVESVLVEDALFNGIVYSNAEEMAANAVVLYTGGVGTTRNVNIVRPRFLQNRTDVTLDNGGVNTNGDPSVDGVKIIDPVVLKSEFAIYHTGLTVSGSAIIDTGDDRLRKEFRPFTTGARIRIAGDLYSVVAYSGSTGLILDRALTVTNEPYMRVNTVPVRRVITGSFRPGQEMVEYTADLSTQLENFLQGDRIINPTPTSGGVYASVVTRGGRYHGSTGNLTSGSQTVTSVTRIETWTAGDTILGPGIPGTAVVNSVNTMAGTLNIFPAPTSSVTGAMLFDALPQAIGAIPVDPTIVPAAAPMTPAAPTLAYSGTGVSGTLVTNLTEVTDSDPARPRYHINATWTPGSSTATYTRFRLSGPTSPAGGKVTSISVAAIKASAAPRTVAFNATGAPDMYIYIANPAGVLTALTLDIYVGYKF